MHSYFAVPTPETKRRFQDIFSSCPFRMDFDTIVVPIAINVQTLLEAPEGFQYAGRVVHFGQRYNMELEYSELVGILDCPELVARHLQLGGREEGFTPRVVFQSPATPIARSNKFFTVSVANSLVADAEPFTFTERVLSK